MHRFGVLAASALALLVFGDSIATVESQMRRSIGQRTLSTMTDAVISPAFIGLSIGADSGRRRIAREVAKPAVQNSRFLREIDRDFNRVNESLLLNCWRRSIRDRKGCGCGDAHRYRLPHDRSSRHLDRGQHGASRGVGPLSAVRQQWRRSARLSLRQGLAISTTARSLPFTLPPGFPPRL